MMAYICLINLIIVSLTLSTYMISIGCVLRKRLLGGQNCLLPAGC
jgi:hypothetical protein